MTGPGEPLRVLQVTAVDFTVAKLLRPLIDFLGARGCEVTTACARGEHWEELQKEGLRLVEIPFRRNLDLLAHLRAAGKLLRHLRRQPYEVVHVHTPVAALVGRWAAARARVPLVLYTVHGFYFHEHMPRPLYRLCVGLERWAARRHHHLFSQSEEDLETARREGIAPPGGATWIGNGVDLDRFDRRRFRPADLEAKRAELGLAPASQVVVHVARLVPHKGGLQLVEAAARVCREVAAAQFLIVGAALRSDRFDDEEAIRRLIRRHRLEERVILAGPRSDIPEILALSSIFALPTTWEGVPRAGIEAMAAGLPAVMSNIRGCREEVVEGETGFLVPVRDVDALAERLLRLLRDRELARRMGEAARERARQRFDERLVLARQWQVIEGLLRARGLTVPQRPASAGRPGEDLGRS